MKYFGNQLLSFQEHNSELSQTTHMPLTTTPTLKAELLLKWA